MAGAADPAQVDVMKVALFGGLVSAFTVSAPPAASDASRTSLRHRALAAAPFRAGVLVRRQRSEAIRQRVLIEVAVKGILRGLQHAAQATAREQGAGPAAGPQTFHQGLVLLVVTDHVAHFDGAGRLRKHHPAARAADRANEASLGKVLDDLVKMIAGDDEFARERVGAKMYIGRGR